MCNVKSQVIQQDVPAVSIELSEEQFNALKQSYDLFTRHDDPGVVILDALSFDTDDLFQLGNIIGAEAAEEGAGQFIFFHVDA